MGINKVTLNLAQTQTSILFLFGRLNTVWFTASSYWWNVIASFVVTELPWVVFPQKQLINCSFQNSKKFNWKRKTINPFFHRVIYELKSGVFSFSFFYSHSAGTIQYNLSNNFWHLIPKHFGSKQYRFHPWKRYNQVQHLWYPIL